MDNVLNSISAFSDWLWGIPMLIFLVGAGIVLTVRTGFVQFRHFWYIMGQTLGSIFKKGKGEGTVSPFQAAATALACTVGASNIVGVPLAIALGGPGAVFWMWVCALIGMATKFAEITLGIKYRHLNEEGVYVGGYMYYISEGLPNKKLGSFLAKIISFCKMCFMPFTIAAQSVSAVQAVEADPLNIPPIATGVILTILIGIVVYGGVKRIAHVTDKLVPIMVIIYLGGALIVLAVNATALPGVFGLIFQSAFTPVAAAGGFAGAGVAAAIRQGMARGTYSTEAGMGSAATGHAAATTDHPCRQGFWGIFEVMVSGLVICTMSGLVVMCTDMWTQVSSDMAGTMPSLAFQTVFGTGIGAAVVAISLLCFVVSTMIVQVFYGEKYAEFLFGLRASRAAKFIYLCSIFLGAILKLDTIYIFLDLILGIMIFPQAISLIWMSGQVTKLKNEFFTDPRYYLKDIAEKRQRKEARKAGKS